MRPIVARSQAIFAHSSQSPQTRSPLRLKGSQRTAHSPAPARSPESNVLSMFCSDPLALGGSRAALRFLWNVALVPHCHRPHLRSGLRKPLSSQHLARTHRSLPPPYPRAFLCPFSLRPLLWRHPSLPPAQSSLPEFRRFPLAFDLRPQCPSPFCHPHRSIRLPRRTVLVAQEVSPLARARW